MTIEEKEFVEELNVFRNEVLIVIDESFFYRASVLLGVVHFSEIFCLTTGNRNFRIV